MWFCFCFLFYIIIHVLLCFTLFILNTSDSIQLFNSQFTVVRNLTITCILKSILHHFEGILSVLVRACVYTMEFRSHLQRWWRKNKLLWDSQVQSDRVVDKQQKTVMTDVATPSDSSIRKKTWKSLKIPEQPGKKTQKAKTLANPVVMGSFGFVTSRLQEAIPTISRNDAWHPCPTLSAE